MARSAASSAEGFDRLPALPDPLGNNWIEASGRFGTRGRLWPRHEADYGFSPPGLSSHLRRKPTRSLGSATGPDFGHGTCLVLLVYIPSNSSTKQVEAWCRNSDSPRASTSAAVPRPVTAALVEALLGERK